MKAMKMGCGKSNAGLCAACEIRTRLSDANSSGIAAVHQRKTRPCGRNISNKAWRNFITAPCGIFDLSGILLKVLQSLWEPVRCTKEHLTFPGQAITVWLSEHQLLLLRWRVAKATDLVNQNQQIWARLLLFGDEFASHIWHVGT